MNRNSIHTAIFTAIWFALITFIIVGVQVNTIDGSMQWHPGRAVFIAIVSFLLSLLWQRVFTVQDIDLTEAKNARNTFWIGYFTHGKNIFRKIRTVGIEAKKKHKTVLLLIISIPLLFLPLLGLYQTKVITSVLVFMLLALSLNVVVGLGGMLNLGVASFFAVGAYTYALLNYHYHVGFLIGFIAAALVSLITGVLVALPVIRLKGDYLAIVTLAFGEIVRIVLENWSSFTFGPSGISNVVRPKFFGMTLNLQHVTGYIYYIAFIVVVLAMFFINRLEHSHYGRSWEAIREDGLASQAMGVDLAKTKMLIFAIGALLAGVAGVVLAISTGYINPKSFTFWQSIIPLCIIVLGGMGTMSGVLLGAIILVWLPEYLRVFSDYRFLVFGIILVVMMIFRPDGLIRKTRKEYQ